MLGIGPQEMLIIGIVGLIVFGSTKASGVARDVGRFVNGANRSVEGLKREVIRRTAETLKSEVNGGERKTANARGSDASHAPRTERASQSRGGRHLLL